MGSFRKIEKKEPEQKRGSLVRLDTGKTVTGDTNPYRPPQVSKITTPSMNQLKQQEELTRLNRMALDPAVHQNPMRMNQLNQQMKGIRAELGKQTVGDRVNDIAGAVFSSSAAGVSNLIGTAADAFGRASGVPGGPEDKAAAANRAAHYREMLKTGRMADGSPMTPETRRQMETFASSYEAQARVFARQEKSFDERHPTLSRVKTGTQGFADQARTDAGRFTEQAKQGLGKAGQLAVDVGIAGGQMGLDALTAALTGGSSLFFMGARSAGDAMQRARLEGADLDQQLKYGLGSAALSVGTERISNIAGPFRKLYGTGAAEKIAGKLVSRFGESGAVRLMTELSKTAGGRIALSAVGEGGEEAIEGALQPFLQRAIYNPDAKFDAAETGRDTLIGAILGGLGGIPGGVNQAAQNRAQAAAVGVEEAPGGGGSAATSQNAAQRSAEAVAEVPVQMPAEVQTPAQTQTQERQQTQGQVPPQVQTPAEVQTDAAPPVQAESNQDPLITALLGDGKRLDQSKLSNEEFQRLAEYSERGLVGMDAAGRVYQVDPSQHIDRRKWNSVGDQHVNAFQYDHPELASYIREAAGILMDDYSRTQRADSYFLDGTERGVSGYDPVLRRTKRSASPEMARLLDSGLTYDRIYQALEAIYNDHGAENYADAKRVELVLDDMLTEGFRGVDGWIDLGPNEAYVQEKSRIAGAEEHTAFDPEQEGHALDELLEWEQQERQAGADGTGLGAADAGSVNTAFDRMQAQSSAFHPVNPGAEARITQNQQRAPSEVPVVNPDTKQNITKTVSTILNSPLTSPEIAVEIEHAVVDGRFDYIPATDRGATEAAQRDLANRGLQTVSAEFLAKVDLGQRITKHDVAAAVSAYNQAVAEGDHATAFELMTALAESAHDSAQVVQAMNLMNRLTPEGRLLTLRRFVDRMNRQQSGQPARNGRRGAATQEQVEIARENFVDQARSFGLSEDLAANYLLAETEEARAAAWDALITDIAGQIPSTFMDKANFLRYTAMLLNPVTHVRNTMGNGIQAGARTIKNGVGTVIERAVIKDPAQRTKSILTGEEGKALKDFARSQYETDRDAAMGAGKYSDASAAGINREIQAKRKIFQGDNLLSRGIQWIGDKNSAALDTEDQWFNRPAYVSAFAQALKAKGVTAAEAAAGVKADLVEAARSYAIEEAQRATYRNTTALSEALAKTGNYRGSNPVYRGASFVADALLPFRRTPANILTTGMDYSPLGILKAVKQGVYDVKRGNCTAADVVDSLSAGLTGTGILALGMYLAAEGLLRVRSGDDDREKDYNKDRGVQEYALQIGDTSYTLDWAVPAAMPLFAGAAIVESVQEGGGTFDSVVSAMNGISQVVLETSMLSALNDFISNWSYADNKVSYGISRTLSAYAGQYMPAIGGKLASIADDTVRKSYVESGTGEVTADIDYFLQGLAKKAPGARNQLQPKVDLWGEDVSNGDLLSRIFQNTISPGFIKTVDAGELDQELRRLADAVGSSAVYPSTVEKSFKVGGETKYLTAEEYTAYARKVGQTRKQVVASIMDSEGYRQLDDAGKAAVIQDAYQYANEIGKMEVSGYTPPSGSVAAGAMKSLLPPDSYILYRHSSDRDHSGGTNYLESAQTLLELPELSDADRGKAWEAFNAGTNQAKNPFTGALAKAGIGAEQAVEIMGRYRELDNREGLSAKERTREFKDWVLGLGLSAEQVKAVRETYRFGGGFAVDW